MACAPRDPLPTEEQRRLLCELIADALIEIRAGDTERGVALADALHNLPRTMYGWGTWSIEGQSARLAHFQRRHPGGQDYMTLFNAVFLRNG
jgi:hypothetical protein